MTDRLEREIEKLLDELNAIIGKLQGMESELDEKFDNLTETAAIGPIGDAVQNMLAMIQDARGQVEEAVMSLEGIV